MDSDAPIVPSDEMVGPLKNSLIALSMCRNLVLSGFSMVFSICDGALVPISNEYAPLAVKTARHGVAGSRTLPTGS
jgi:hypothetical protein